MFKLKSLHLHNFLAIQDVILDFAKPGLYLISGYNAIGGDSNGCGKSTILAGISYALFNKTPGGLHGKEVENWGSRGSGKSYYAELVLSGPEGIYTVYRGDDKLELKINNNILKGHKKDIQDLINEIFNTSPDIFFSSTLFTSNISDYISRMGDAEKKRLFKSVLRLGKLDEAYQKTKAEHDGLSYSLSSLETEISILKDLIEKCKSDILELEYQEFEYEKRKERKIQELRSKIGTPPVPSSIGATIKSSQDFIEGIEKQLGDTGSVESDVVIELTKANRLLGAITNSIDKLTKQRWEVESLGGHSECDKCGSQLGPKYEEHLKKINDSIQTEIEKEVVVRTSIKKIEDHLKNIEGLRSLINKGKDELSMLKFRQDEEEREKLEYGELKQSIEDRIQEIIKEFNPIPALLDKQRSQLNDNLLQIQSKTESLESLSKKYDMLSFLKFVFSREGVAAQIIEKSFSSLQSLANNYLSKICSENLFIHIAPQRELKSKALKEEIDIYVTQGHSSILKIPYTALSGGQQQRVNIALLIALYKFCRNMGINDFDFILADEIFDLSMADKGREDVINLMRELLYQEVGQIVVISHQSNISSNFDYEIIVQRDVDGISRVM